MTPGLLIVSPMKERVEILTKVLIFDTIVV